VRRQSSSLSRLISTPDIRFEASILQLHKKGRTEEGTSVWGGRRWQDKDTPKMMRRMGYWRRGGSSRMGFSASIKGVKALGPLAASSSASRRAMRSSLISSVVVFTVIPAASANCRSSSFEISTVSPAPPAGGGLASEGVSDPSCILKLEVLLPKSAR